MAIKAKNIVAVNIVEGVQFVPPGDKEIDPVILQAAGEAAKQILATGHTGIEADEIKASNIVEGFQYIQNPAQPTLDELRKELAAKVLAISADPAIPATAKTALAEAHTEAQKKQPEPKKLLESLKTLSESVKNVAEAGPNVLKIAKWVPFIVKAAQAWAGVP